MGIRGLFCVFEGIDGSGKSTLQKETAAALAPFSDRVLLLKEPTDGPTGKIIRAHLMRGDNLDAEQWLELFLEDRRENTSSNIQPALEEGKIILQDRYYYSTAAYQGFEDTEYSPLSILNMNRAENFPEADLLFFLDVTPETAMKRIHATRRGRESFETLEQLRRIYNYFRQILPENTIIIPGKWSIEEATRFVSDQIKSRL